jgi:diguanylate cyclase (GGDEF)-like protein
MFALDPLTILFMTTLMCVAMSVAMLAVHLSFRHEVKGVGHWAGGLLAMVVAGAAFMLRGALPGVLPEALLLPAANICLTWGIGLSMLGTRQFYGAPSGLRLFHGVWLLELLAMLYWLVVAPDFSARVAAYSFLVGIFYLDQLRQVLRQRERSFASVFFCLLLVLQTAAVATRGVAALLVGPAAADLMRGSGLASFYLAAANFMVLLLTVAFLMMATRRLQTILEQRSTHDPLTGALNRRGFAQCYERVLAEQHRRGGKLALLVIDLDHFKAINDRFGHATGDQVLVWVAAAAMQTARATDYVTRFGGEEFVVLLPDSSEQRASQVAARLQALLRDYPQAGLPPCTVSVGIACQAEGGEGLDSLLARADAALYRAKTAGRDRVELATMVAKAA